LHYHRPKTQDSAALNTPSPSLDTLQHLRQQDPEFAASEGTAFDTVVTAFLSLVEDMQRVIVQYVADTVRTRCRKYKKEK